MKNPCVQAVALSALTTLAMFTAPVVRAQPAQQAPELGRDQARQLIERRLQQVERQQHRLARAMDMLESGQSLQEIRKVLDESAPGPMSGAPAAKERVLDVLKAMNPELYQRVQKLREEHPERAKQLLHRIQSERRMQELAALLEHNPEEFQARVEQLAIERQAMQAARRFVDASAKGDEDAARQARQEARSLVAQLVEKQFTQQHRSFQRAEERLNRVRAELEEHQANPDPVIDARLEALLRRAMAQAGRGGDVRPRRTPDRRDPKRDRPPQQNHR